MERRASINRGEAPAGADIEVLAADDRHLDLSWLRERLLAALAHVPRQISSLVVSVVSDERMIALNQRHRGEPATTDVLAFEHSRAPEALEADIVVCGDVAERRAAQLGHRAEQELLLYALHGVLHCAGFDDRDEGRSAAMHAEEDRILCAIGVGPTFARGGEGGGPDPEPGRG
jgi:probable rRNA maturation factor